MGTAAAGHAGGKHPGGKHAGGKHAGRARGSVALVAGVAAVGGLLFGCDTGIISGAILYLRTDFGSGPTAEGLVVGVPWLRADLGSSVTFFVDAAPSVATIAFVLARVPETKVRTREEIGRPWQ